MKYAVLAALAGSLCAQVRVTRAPDRISVEIGGKPYTALFFGADVGKPYLHPLRAASGVVVTRLYPMENGAGEPKDHPHHRGLWFSHGDVNGYDFWGTEVSERNAKTGRIVLKHVGELKSGDNSGTLNATFEWMTPEGKPILREKREMVFYAGPADRVIDFDATLEPLEKVKFGDTKEGTFAIRVAPGLKTMVSSTGGRGEKECWGKRADWMDYFGEVNGEKVGIAIVDHPENPRHPTWWHVRAYGLFAANIFGLHDFTNDKTADGSLTVEPGHPLRFRYRVIVHSGEYKGPPGH